MRLQKPIHAARSTGALLPGAAGDYISTPDAASISLTTNIDLIVKVAATTWNNGAAQILIAKEGASGAYGYNMYLNGDSLNLFTSPDGTTVVVATADALPSTVVTNGVPYWLRATRVAATGAVNFFTSPDGATWTALGTAQATTAGGIFDNTQALEIGSRNTGMDPFAGRFFFAEVRSTIGGSPVAQFNCRSTTRGRTVANSGTGHAWTKQGNAVFQ